MKKILSFLSIFAVCLLALPVSANNINYDQGIYDTLNETNQHIYAVSTKGFHGVPLQASIEEVKNRAGNPGYEKTARNNTYLFYSHYHGFKLVALQFDKRNQLISITFLKPNKETSKSKRAEVKQYLGEPNKKKAGQLIYLLNNSPVTIVRDKFLWFESLQRITIGEIANKMEFSLESAKASAKLKL